MDYLLRDAYFTGLAGCRVDVDWINNKNNLVILDEEDFEKYRGKAPERMRLGVSIKAADAVAHMLLIRKRVYSAICFHKKVRLLEELFVRFLKGLMDEVSPEKGSDEKVSGISPCLRDFLVCCKDLKKAKERDEDAKGKFLKEAYPSYRILVDFDLWSVIRYYAEKGNGMLKEIAKCIYNRKLHKAYPVISSVVDKRYFSSDLNSVEKIIKHGDYKSGSEKSWKVILVKSSFKLYDKDENNPKDVFIKTPSCVQTLDEVSDVISCHEKIEEKRAYLMVHPDLIDDNGEFNKLKSSLEMNEPHGSYVDFGSNSIPKKSP